MTVNVSGKKETLGMFCEFDLKLENQSLRDSI